eukprot:gene34164-42123_t
MPATPQIRTEHVKSRHRRTVLRAGSALLLSVMAPLSARAAQILAVRVWPAADYTRVTLENDSNLKATHFVVKDPERLVVDIEGLELNPTLKSLVAKIQSNDPYIRQVRVGQNRPNVVRLVFDLKEEVTPQVFALAPAGQYKHRLIFDLYPVNAVDPIAAMIEKGDWSDAPALAPGEAIATAPATSPAAAAHQVDVAALGDHLEGVGRDVFHVHQAGFHLGRDEGVVRARGVAGRAGDFQLVGDRQHAFDGAHFALHVVLHGLVAHFAGWAA